MELLAPAGDWSMLRAAIKAGCDAVYFGIQGLNMRAAANNFSIEELSEIINYCHQHNVKAHCTVNIIIFQKELSLLHTTLTALKLANIDAVICWDLAVIKQCQEWGITVHLSTQASVSNSEAAKAWKGLGVTRIVLARECSLEDIGDFKKKEGKVESVFTRKLKVFVGGVERTKKDGTKVRIPIDPSNLMIMELNMEDKYRQKIMERK